MNRSHCKTTYNMKDQNQGSISSPQKILLAIGMFINEIYLSEPQNTYKTISKAETKDKK